MPGAQNHYGYLVMQHGAEERRPREIRAEEESSSDTEEEPRPSCRTYEGKRLELERKLFEYNSSDAHISHLKYMKLKHSLKEICERGKRARLRNQAFLKEIDHIEAHIRSLMSNTDKLQHMKMLQVSRQAEINTGVNMSRRMYHPATIFMGRQMSANSSIEHCLTQRKSPQPTKSFSISDPHSVRQAAINGNVTDSCVVPANSDIQCLNKPDKIDGETSFQISQKMPVTSIASSEAGRTDRVEIDKTQRGRKHLVESKQSAQLRSQTRERLSPDNRARDLQYDSPGNKVEDALMYESLVTNEERFTHASSSGSSPDACDYINKQTSEKRSGCGNLSDEVQASRPILKQEDNEFCDSSSSGLTVSISESEEISSADSLDMVDGGEAKPQAITSPEPEAEVAVMIANEGTTKINVFLTTEQNSYEESSSVSTISQNHLSDKGFFHLLQSIEGVVLNTPPKHLELYQNTDVSQTKLDHLISLCNQMDTLKEDLEPCSALVLHQLQRLLKSTLTGGSLTEEILTESISNTDEKRARPISSLLQERLLDHISFLKEHQILKEGDIPKCFATLLMFDDKTKCCQGLSHSVDVEKDVASMHSNETQCRLVMKQGYADDKPYKSGQCLNGKTRKQGLTLGSSNFKTKPSNKLSSEASFSSSEQSPISRLN
ncbi:hypothetical protein FKM82_010477 [Ascaphus truei]